MSRHMFFSRVFLSKRVQETLYKSRIPTSNLYNWEKQEQFASRQAVRSALDTKSRQSISKRYSLIKDSLVLKETNLDVKKTSYYIPDQDLIPEIAKKFPLKGDAKITERIIDGKMYRYTLLSNSVDKIFNDNFPISKNLEHHVVNLMRRQPEFISLFDLLTINRGLTVIVTEVDHDIKTIEYLRFKMGNTNIIQDSYKTFYLEYLNRSTGFSKKFWTGAFKNHKEFNNILFYIGHGSYVSLFVLLNTLMLIFVCVVVGNDNEFITKLRTDLKNNLTPENCFYETGWWDNETGNNFTNERLMQIKTIANRKNLEKFVLEFIMFRLKIADVAPVTDDVIYADDKYSFSGKELVMKSNLHIVGTGLKMVKLRAQQIIHQENKIIVKFSREMHYVNGETRIENSILVFHLKGEICDGELAEKISKMIYYKDGKYVIDPQNPDDLKSCGFVILSNNGTKINEQIVKEENKSKKFESWIARWDYGV